jgi:hypothetical protein
MNFVSPSDDRASEGPFIPCWCVVVITCSFQVLWLSPG